MGNHKMLLLLAVLYILTTSWGLRPNNQFYIHDDIDYGFEFFEFVERSHHNLEAGSLAGCLDSKNVPISVSQDLDFQALSRPYNLRLLYTPAVIVVPFTHEHIQDAVICAAQHHTKVQAKSGGHSYASYSSGGQNGSMVIDLQRMHAISLDDSTGIAKVGGGVRLGNLAQTIYDQSRRALPHGDCPSTGIGGHATHGGYGYASRLWGLAMDAIVGLDVVLANGSYIHANATSYPDVYWALRGAADSFGIVVNFYMQTHPAPDTVTYFRYNFSDVLSNKAAFTKTFMHIQDFVKDPSVIDERIGLGLKFNHTHYVLDGGFIGSKEEFTSHIEPKLLGGLPNTPNPIVKSLSYIDFLIELSGAESMNVPSGALTGYDEHFNFFAKSISVPESAGLTPKTLNALYDYIDSTQFGAHWWVSIKLYGGPGSAINTKGADFAAYSGRDSLWVLQNYGYTEAAIPFINGINNAIINAQKETKFGAYINYVDPTLTADEAHSIYYGEEIYSRLQDIKRVVEPQMVFWHPQAVAV